MTHRDSRPLVMCLPLSLKHENAFLERRNVLSRHSDAFRLSETEDDSDNVTPLLQFPSTGIKQLSGSAACNVWHCIDQRAEAKLVAQITSGYQYTYASEHQNRIANCKACSCNTGCVCGTELVILSVPVRSNQASIAVMAMVVFTLISLNCVSLKIT